MKTILCFGDSLTWGFNPEDGTRHLYENRWTSVLEKNLSAEYKVIVEGLNGRTTIFDDKYSADRNGSTVLPMLLESHTPLDLLIIMLGTNDIQPHREVSAKEAARGCSVLLNKALKSAAGPNGVAPKILLLSPPTIGQPLGWMDTVFGESQNDSKQFALHYQRAAEIYGVNFLDTAPLVKVSAVDGIHLDAKENIRLGEFIAHEVKKII